MATTNPTLQKLMQKNNMRGAEAPPQVAPDHYGDNSTRQFAYWSVEGIPNQGCFNYLCPGFVQVDKKYGVGFATLEEFPYRIIQCITYLLLRLGGLELVGLLLRARGLVAPRIISEFFCSLDMIEYEPPSKVQSYGVTAYAEVAAVLISSLTHHAKEAIVKSSLFRMK
ncbi:hypothetical protein IFM89_019851 [Coptis chinensis]|uniref:Neprosin PEP catalytic domain-containing protein n=1 Tax=Coptis chinensis TaxID=261450 RepID=A0A835HV61_9MAGN|nr:hypothetical protein IFM89_019851 [Coptis chinensis]